MKPGSFDTLHFEKLFYSDNAYGIPILECGKAIEASFIPFNIVTKCKGKGVHSFVYDYYMERIWKRPEVYVKYLIESVLYFTPDFSLYIDTPISLQIYNTYRNRWVGAYMQERGVNVIPTVTWSIKDSYQFAFLGIEINSPVAISTIGILKDNEVAFKQGFEEMVKRINPQIVYLCGVKYIDYLSSICNIIYIDSFSEGMRKRINNK